MICNYSGTFSDIGPLHIVGPMSRLCRGEASRGRRRRGARCAGIAAARRVRPVARRVQPRQAAARLVPEVALRPFCNDHSFVKIRRVFALWNHQTYL